MGCLVYANSQVWFCIWPWVRPWTWFLHVDFFPFFFLINAPRRLTGSCVCFFPWNDHLRKCLFSGAYWSLCHETCPYSDVTSCTWFARMNCWSFPPIHASISSPKVWLPVPYLVKILRLPGFLGKPFIQAAVSICLACLGFWLYTMIIS